MGRHLKSVPCIRLWNRAIEMASAMRFGTQPTSETLLDRDLELFVNPNERMLSAGTVEEIVRSDAEAMILAGRLYALDHGELPARAELLVPDYLTHVPGDLFSDSGAPLELRIDGRNLSVWSVGLREGAKVYPLAFGEGGAPAGGCGCDARRRRSERPPWHACGHPPCCSPCDDRFDSIGH